MMTFSGAQAQVESAGGSFRPLHYPNRGERVEGRPWSERELLVMINSNKRAHPGRELLHWRRPYRSARVLGAKALASYRRFAGSPLPPDFYDARLDALEFFAVRPGFSLYGVGWDDPPRGRRHLDLSRCYRGAVLDKRKTLGDYKFALCFENTEYPGYVTEKIFDCFFAGTIPIYRGAPDIEDEVPSEAFLNVRTFSSFADLDECIRSIRPGEAEAYRSAAVDFLRSERFLPFSDIAFVDTLWRVVCDVAS